MIESVTEGGYKGCVGVCAWRSVWDTILKDTVPEKKILIIVIIIIIIILGRENGLLRNCSCVFFYRFFFFFLSLNFAHYYAIETISTQKTKK